MNLSDEELVAAVRLDLAASNREREVADRLDSALERIESLESELAMLRDFAPLTNAGIAP